VAASTTDFSIKETDIVIVHYRVIVFSHFL
jgi:hypothetical protein